MENQEDLRSITGLLPLRLRSSSLLWPSDVVDALKVLSRGPHHSSVHSGEVLFHAISDLRNSLGISAEQLGPYASEGYAHFFDEVTRSSSIDTQPTLYIFTMLKWLVKDLFSLSVREVEMKMGKKRIKGREEEKFWDEGKTFKLLVNNVEHIKITRLISFCFIM